MSSTDNNQSKDERKPWDEPRLVKLSADLRSIELRRRGSTDFRGVGSIS